MRERNRVDPLCLGGNTGRTTSPPIVQRTKRAKPIDWELLPDQWPRLSPFPKTGHPLYLSSVVRRREMGAQRQGTPSIFRPLSGDVKWGHSLGPPQGALVRTPNIRPTEPSGIKSKLPEIRLLWEVSLSSAETRIAVLDGPVDLSQPCFRSANLIRLQSLMSDSLSRLPCRLTTTFQRSPDDACTGRLTVCV